MATLDRNAIIQNLLNLNSLISQVRQEERNIKAKEQSNAIMFSELAVDGSSEGDLKSKLMQLLPKHLVPSNVGAFNDAMWPFFYELEFDFGTNPTYDQSTSLTKTFRVSQESGFILTNIYRRSDDDSVAGFKAPLTAILRDAQSSRQIMDNPMPIGSFGGKSEPTRMVANYYFQPNALVSLELKSFLGSAQPTVGNGKHIITIAGYRVRQNEQGAIINTMLGR